MSTRDLTHQPATTELPVDRFSIYFSSILATAVAFLLGVGLPCWYAFGVAWGAGLGVMCAVWGGPGFGVMMAGARISMIEEDAHQ